MFDSELVERVAKAIHESGRLGGSGGPGYESLMEELKRQYRILAEAALTAAKDYETENKLIEISGAI